MDFKKIGDFNIVSGNTIEREKKYSLYQFYFLPTIRLLKSSWKRENDKMVEIFIEWLIWWVRIGWRIDCGREARINAIIKDNQTSN